MNLRAHIVDLLHRHRLTLSDEKLVQQEIATCLSGDGLLFRREFRLSAADIVDFMVLERAEGEVSGCAIEVKIKGARRAIFRQVERYCAYEQVTGIVLATNVAMSLPADINGKPTAIAHLGRGWL